MEFPEKSCLSSLSMKMAKSLEKTCQMVFLPKNFSALVLKFLWQKNQKTLNVGKSRKQDEDKKSRNNRFPYFNSLFYKKEKAQNTPEVAGCLLFFVALWICAKGVF